MRKTSKISIDIYDADGTLCECIGGPMDYEDVKEQMLEALKNDGIPVIRRHGKHEKGEPAHDQLTNAMPPMPKFEPLLQLRWEYEGVKFDAVGKYDDVMDAQAEFIRAMMEG